MRSKAVRVGCLWGLVGLLAGDGLLASAQLIEVRTVNGREIGCARSGLMGWYRNCGTDDFYSQIFVGTVQSVTPVKVGEWDEFRLVLQPEEIFRGEVPPGFTVTTNQGLCLPPIHAGDRWLFYIYTDKDRGPLLEYGHDGRPLQEAQQDVERLRNLAHMKDAGMVMGHLQSGFFGGDDEDVQELAHREVQLIAKANGRVFRALSDQDDRFEFEPVPQGQYKLSVPAISGLWTGDGGEFKVEGGSCKDFFVKVSPDGQLTGHVRLAGGRPAGSMRVYALRDDGNGWSSATVDEHGFFQFHGVRAGRYRIGVGFGTSESNDGPAIAVYFPGVASREDAGIVDLGQAEHRTGLDFVIPRVIPR